MLSKFESKSVPYFNNEHKKVIFGKLAIWNAIKGNAFPSFTNFLGHCYAEFGQSRKLAREEGNTGIIPTKERTEECKWDEGLIVRNSITDPPSIVHLLMNHNPYK